MEKSSVKKILVVSVALACAGVFGSAVRADTTVSSGGTFNTTNYNFTWTSPGGAVMDVSPTNQTDDTLPRTMTLNGGTLSVPLGGGSIGMHFTGYYSTAYQVLGTDGVVPQANWNNLNIQTWNNPIYGNVTGNFSNLIYSNGTSSGASVGAFTNLSGWQGIANTGSWGSYLSTEPLLNSAIAGNNAYGLPISNILYAKYNVIAYLSQGWNLSETVSLAGNPASAYYFNSMTTGSPNPFVHITNQTPGVGQAGNYVEWDGLTGLSQEIDVLGDSGTRPMIAGFQIVNATPGGINVSNTTLAITAPSTFSGGSGAATFGALQLSNSNTTLTLTNATSATFGNVTATGVGNSPGASVTGVSAVTITGTNVDATNASDTLTLPATNFTNSSVTVNAAGLGKVILTGSASFTGATTLNVNAGKLQISGAVNGSSTAINVASGAILSAHGTAGSLSLATGGMIDPGAATLTAPIITLADGSIYRWTFTDSSHYSLLNATGTLSLPAAGPTLRLVSGSVPSGFPCILATFSTAPTNEPTTWAVDASELPAGSTAVWTGGASGTFDAPSNWTGLSYSGATVAYTATQVELTGLTVGYSNSTLAAPLNATNSLTIAPPNVSTNVIVTGSASPLTINSLNVGLAAKAPATVELDLQSGGSLTIDAGLLVDSNGTLATNGANLTVAGTLSSGGVLDASGSSTVTAPQMNVVSGTTTFGASSIAALTNVEVSGGGQLSMSGSGSIGALSVVSAGATGVNIGGTVAVGAGTFSGGTTTFTASESMTTASVSNNAIVNFDGASTGISDTTTGLTVSGNGSVSFGAGAAVNIPLLNANGHSVTFATSSTGTVGQLNVTTGTVSVGGQTVTAATLTGGSTTMTGTGTIGSASLSGSANLTASAGTVSAITFSSAGYTGTTILSSGTTGPATVTVPASLTGTVTLNNSNAMTGLTVAGGTVSRTGDTATVNQSNGGLTVAGNITGTATLTGGTFSATSGNIANLSLPAGSTSVATLAAGTSASTVTVGGGTANLNGAVTTLNGGGTINFGPAASVASANLRAGTANTQGNAVAFSGLLMTSGSTLNWTPGAAAAFTVNSANITDDNTARTITLAGGTLATPPIGGAIGVHWSGYLKTTGVFNPTTAPSGDGAPGYELANWNNVTSVYQMGFAGNLVNSAGNLSTIAARLGTGGSATDYAFGSYGTGSTEPLLDGAGGYDPLATQITGITYASYKVILFVNSFGNTNGHAWVGGTAAGGGSQTYYFQTTGTSSTFVQSSSTSSTDYATGNYVVFDGLTGANQLIYLNNNALFVAPPALVGNYISNTGGFEIINTTSPNTNLPQTAISATATSTLDLSAPGGSVTLGDVSVSNAGTALTVKSAGAITLGNVVLNAGTALNVGANASANHGLVTLKSLAVDPTSSVDLSNHDLYISGGAGSLASLLTASGSLVKTSSTLGALPAMAIVGPPPASATLAIALLSGSEFIALGKTGDLLDGVTVSGGDLVGVLAYAGDANLDGKITVDDYMALNLGYLFGLKGWTHGDFAQTGTITAEDYAIIDNNYRNQSGSVADGEITIHTQWFGAAYTDAFNALNAPAAVPEPASLALLAAGALGLLRRKNRK